MLDIRNLCSILQGQPTIDIVNARAKLLVIAIFVCEWALNGEMHPRIQDVQLRADSSGVNLNIHLRGRGSMAELLVRLVATRTRPSSRATALIITAQAWGDVRGTGSGVGSVVSGSWKSSMPPVREECGVRFAVGILAYGRCQPQRYCLDSLEWILVDRARGRRPRRHRLQVA